MSKLSFRARALDAAKPMPIYMSEELPDLPDYSAINRAVPQMPSGMEKEEECEHHLQRAICAGLIIPTPEVYDLADEEAYNRIYTADYKIPRQLIHMPPFAMEQDIPDYDMDSEDERWVNAQSKKMDITALKFEEMMDRLEKASGQTVVTLQEAKILLKEDDDLTIAVYDYWLNKRLKTQHPLIPQMKSEGRVGSGSSAGGGSSASAASNPYLAFRRRTEKMQTRKNRKNDETSYEKMLKLRRDLVRATTILEMVKRREKLKREYLHLSIEVFEKRYNAADFCGQLLAELMAKSTRPAFAPLFSNQFGMNQNWANKVSSKEESMPRKEKRQYKKRKHKSGVGSARVSGLGMSQLMGSDASGVYGAGDTLSSEEEDRVGGHSPGAASPSDQDDETDTSEGPFVFRRKKHCNYHAPLSGGMGNWPWCSREEGGMADRKYRYCLTSISKPQPQCIGFARRRVGRGGRVILDRACTSMDEYWASLDFTISEAGSSNPRVGTSSEKPADDFISEIKNEWLHFRPKTPPVKSEEEDEEESDGGEKGVDRAYELPSTISVDIEEDGAIKTVEYLIDDLMPSIEGMPALSPSVIQLLQQQQKQLLESQDEDDETSEVEESSEGWQGGKRSGGKFGSPPSPSQSSPPHRHNRPHPRHSPLHPRMRRRSSSFSSQPSSLFSTSDTPSTASSNLTDQLSPTVASLLTALSVVRGQNRCQSLVSTSSQVSVFPSPPSHLGKSNCLSSSPSHGSGVSCDTPSGVSDGVELVVGSGDRDTNGAPGRGSSGVGGCATVGTGSLSNGPLQESALTRHSTSSTSQAHLGHSAENASSSSVLTSHHLPSIPQSQKQSPNTLKATASSQSLLSTSSSSASSSSSTHSQPATKQNTLCLTSAPVITNSSSLTNSLSFTTSQLNLLSSVHTLSSPVSSGVLIPSSASVLGSKSVGPTVSSAATAAAHNSKLLVGGRALPLSMATPPLPAPPPPQTVYPPAPPMAPLLPPSHPIQSSSTLQKEVALKGEEVKESGANGGEKEKASNQVCVDKLVRKNSLPMEVT
ncbi:enhancer of polycomb homolog 1 [Ischnura elegans]|uniref:enhancer of polycomb homolog 1 n=1 Tax=Ischnura elegans TaxID=197161 RepID=UPI001ED88BA3|nr:enhancer of polycomb homolog 1 [Ischnura elegans]